MYWSPYGSGTTKYVDPHIEAFNNMQDEYWVVREYNGGYYDQIAKLMATEKNRRSDFRHNVRCHTSQDE